MAPSWLNSLKAGWRRALRSDPPRAGRRRRGLVAVGLALVFGLIFIEPLWLVRGDFGSDDASYFSHAATLALDLDLDYANEPVVAWSADRRIAIGSPGAGWLAAPFVAGFSLVDRATGHPVVEDHRRYTYSWALFGFFVASLFYFVLGVWLYRRGIEALWPGLDPAINLLLALGTGVPFYVLRRFTMAHSFEFAACALGFWAAARLYRALALEASTRPWIAWSAVAALANLAIRINNLNTLILGHTLVLVFFVFKVGGLPRPAWIRVRGALVRLSAAIAVALAPLALFDLVFYGAIYPTPARMYGQPLAGTASRSALEILGHGLTLVPNLVPLIFSSEWGVLYTNPVVVLGGAFLVGALAWRLGHRRDLPHSLALLATLAFFGLSTAIVLWWQSTASSYGYRYLFPLYPVALAGLLIAARGGEKEVDSSGAAGRLGSAATGRARAGGGAGGRMRRALLPAAVALSVVSVASQTFFSANAELEVHGQENVYGIYHSASANGYLTRLPGEMIEPDTWASLAARRLVGFFLAPNLAEGEIRRRLPEEWLESYDRLYRETPPDVYIQLALILLLWGGAAWLLTGAGGATTRAATPDRSARSDPPPPASAARA